MRKLWIPTLVGVTMAVSLMQLPSDSADAWSPARQDSAPALSGRVIAEDGAVAGPDVWVLLEAVGGEAWLAAVGYDGQYEIRDLRHGRYLITVFGAGFQTLPDAETLYVRGEPLLRSYTLSRRVENGEVSGRVTDRVTGEPVAGAQVRLVSFEAAPIVATSTAGDGTFRLGNVPRAKYTACASGRGWGVMPNAGPIDLESEQVVTDILFELPGDAQELSLKGTVTSGDEGLSEVEILAVGGSTRELYLARTDATGSYEIPVADPSQLFVWARRYDCGGVWLGSSRGWTFSDLRSGSGQEFHWELEGRAFGPWSIGGKALRLGRPVDCGWVEAVDSRGRLCDISPVWPGGLYRLNHLLSGTYELRLYDPGQGLVADARLELERKSVSGFDLDAEVLSSR